MTRLVFSSFFLYTRLDVYCFAIFVLALHPLDILVPKAVLIYVDTQYTPTMKTSHLVTNKLTPIYPKKSLFFNGYILILGRKRIAKTWSSNTWLAVGVWEQCNQSNASLLTMVT